MAENTQNGPAGGNKPAMPAKKPANHTPAKPGANGRGADASSAPYKKSGPLKPVQ